MFSLRKCFDPIVCLLDQDLSRGQRLASPFWVGFVVETGLRFFLWWYNMVWWHLIFDQFIVAYCVSSAKGVKLVLN